MPDGLPPRHVFTDRCASIIDTIEGDHGDDTIYALEHELRDWYYASRADGFPTRASGAEPSHGATNVVHNFGSDEAPLLLEVPQHSDSTGETVLRRIADADEHDADPKLRAITNAHRHLEIAQAEIRKARNELRRGLQPPETLDDVRDDARSREWCWNCLRFTVDGGGRHHVPVYREVDCGGIRTPLCRHCAEWWYAEGEPRPLPVVGADARGERLTSARLAELLHPPRVGQGKGKKSRRRKAG